MNTAMLADLTKNFERIVTDAEDADSTTDSAAMERVNLGAMNSDSPNIQLILAYAGEELRHLMRERAALTRRIGAIKQTIRGLSSLFGEDARIDGVLRECGEAKPAIQRPGLTQSCRAALLEFERPCTARELSEHLQRNGAPGMRFSKNLAAAVAVVLDRLVKYGEARVVLRENGRRAWVRAPQDENRFGSGVNFSD